jgi:hypothetical protein
MEGYQLEEEPDRDIVMLEDNSDIYMRIEVLSNDVNFIGKIPLFIVCDKEEKENWLL